MDIKGEQRPWGSFEQFTHNEISTVKILDVKAGEKFSLQYHNNRDEFWKVIEGNPTIIIGDEEKISKEGEEFFIFKKTKHRIQANEKDAKVLEISFGVFDEHDEVRLEDAYGRADK